MHENAPWALSPACGAHPTRGWAWCASALNGHDRRLRLARHAAHHPPKRPVDEPRSVNSRERRLTDTLGPKPAPISVAVAAMAGVERAGAQRR
eukprot:CAMPEP_0180070686 /NCGR_PEP_ID=MMETSP0985-20121206/11723_1 /TAXON_ID=483367 /ORGANISM="non described non described, Strain CCMP 2436" /LENGTH=92 /DNA_ID=CAMNT_0022001823 /DNA_START=289 /DNA_END=564 /DNA_ORIENTATION=+